MEHSAIGVSHHVFISYSKQDHALAEKILLDLERSGFETWIDNKALEPGTPDWESNIRRAIYESYAVILVCTPNTANSQHVQAEAKLAQKHDRRILPIWISGDYWVDCIPLGLVNYQYIDLRAGSYASGLSKLVSQLRKWISQIKPKLFLVDSLAKCPDSFIPILISKQDDKSLGLTEAADIIDIPNFREGLPNYLQVLVINPNAYTCFEELTNDIYTGFLRNRYGLYTYGKEWVLAKASVYVTLLALPWEWLKHRRRKLLIEIIPDYIDRRTPLQEYGISDLTGLRAGQVWAIVNDGFDKACGIFTMRDTIAEQAFCRSTKGLSFKLDRTLRAKPPSADRKVAGGLYRLRQLDPTKYRYKLVIVPDPFIAQGLADDAVFVIE